MEGLLTLLQDGDMCLTEARSSLLRSRELLDVFRHEGTASGCVER